MLEAMERLGKLLAIMLAIGAVSALINARMSHQPPILWGEVFAGLVGGGLIAVLWLAWKELDEN